uniref:Cat eye syndrome critical region protein 5-like n=1 Tax=Heterorhabditis bacteriophora TaxID=37862 RepID=A0A1I7XA52_HETBA
MLTAKRIASLLLRQYGRRVTNSFGIVLDIDGVLLRGRELLPRVKDAFRLITDENNSFQIPTVFLTNGTNCMRKEKAEKLSDHLGFPITPHQVIMAHSPLRMFHDLHKKHVLVVGQSNARSIAEA